jgi:hypothetical protein
MRLRPFQSRAAQTGEQSPRGCSNTLNGSMSILLEHRHVAWRPTSQMIANLVPDELNRVKFWRIAGKVIRVQAWVLRDVLLNDPTTMDGCVVPHQHDRSCNRRQQLLEKRRDVPAIDRFEMTTDAQPHLSSTRRDQQCTDQAQPRVVAQTRADARRLSLGCPTALERRQQGKPAFIDQNQGRLSFTPLFLSWATRSAASVRFRRHRVATPSAVVSDCSSPCASSSARHCWDGSVPRTSRKSHAPSDLASSDHPHRNVSRRPRQPLAEITVALVCQCPGPGRPWAG